jgi:phosphate acetyltransferase
MSLLLPRSEALVARARSLGAVRTAVVYPCSVAALTGATEAASRGLITPLLIGPKTDIERVAAANHINIAQCEIHDVAGERQSAAYAAGLVRDGAASLLMKGSLHTDELMTVVVSRDAGLRTTRRVSHVFAMDVPNHPRWLLIADAAINIAPDLAIKRDITLNAIAVAHAMGIAHPRVAVLSAVEIVNPAMPSSVDAGALRDMALRGEINGAIIEGPLAFDNAFSAEAARVKGIQSGVSGNVDAFIMPSIESGNIFYKSMVYMHGATAAGVVMGARVPIILTSRADDTASRIASAALACVVAHARG